MPKYKTLKETYIQCESEGHFKKSLEVNLQKVKDLVSNARVYINSADLLTKIIKKEDPDWMTVYVNYYEALRIYTEAFVYLNNVKISNHQCLFAYLCTKYKKHEFDWNFFEQIRRKRNGAHYYGTKIEYTDWESIKTRIKIFIDKLDKEIKIRVESK